MRSKQTSDQCKRTSKRTSEWSSTAVGIIGYSGPQCGAKKVEKMTEREEREDGRVSNSAVPREKSGGFSGLKAETL